MCGIFGYVGHKNAKDSILDGLKRLEYRGYDSWGVAVINNGDISTYREVGVVSGKSLHRWCRYGLLRRGTNRILFEDVFRN